MNYRQKKTRDAGTPDLFQEPLTSYRENIQEFFEIWNSRMWLPKLAQSDRQCALVKNAMLRPFFQKHWRKSIEMLSKSSFVISKMRPKFTLDWYCVSDNFDKILEGKYLDEKHQTQPEQKSMRNGDDEELL